MIGTEVKASMQAPTGTLAVLKRTAPKDLIRDPIHGHYKKGRENLLIHNQTRETPVQQKVLAWLRDHINRDIPSMWYNAVLGHDAHISVYAELHAQHFHYGEPDPFTGKLEYVEVPRSLDDLPKDHPYWQGVLFPGSRIEGDRLIELQPGWWENIGRVSRKKVTVNFRNFIVDQLQAETAEFGDFKFHRVGTSATAEANTDVALTTDAGITGVAGTQTETTADIYRTVATVTADATETWQEHGIFSQAGTTTPLGTLMDRSLISPTVSVVANDTVQFTYSITFNAEA